MPDKTPDSTQPPQIPQPGSGYYPDETASPLNRVMAGLVLTIIMIAVMLFAFFIFGLLVLEDWDHVQEPSAVASLATVGM